MSRAQTILLIVGVLLACGLAVSIIGAAATLGATVPADSSAKTSLTGRDIDVLALGS